MRKQIAGYIRVSTAKQKNNGISLEMQKKCNYRIRYDVGAN